MEVIKLKRNDTAPALVAILLDDKQQPVELTDLNTIKFIMKERFYFEKDKEDLKVQNSENVSIAEQDGPDTRGKFQYNWSSEDIDTSGDFIAEFQITLNGLECQFREFYKLTDGMTLDIKVDGESTPQIITFLEADFSDINLASAEEIVAKINSVLTGGRATASDSKTRLLLQTENTDLDGSIQVVGGTANSILGFDTSLYKNKRTSLPTEGILIQILEDLDEN